MIRRALPATFGVAALVADLGGAHGLALAVLFLAIPAAFVLTLDCYADAVEARCGGLRPALSALALLLLLLSAALRSPAVVGGVPRLAISAIVFALVVYAGAALTVLAGPPRRAQRLGAEEAATENERLAA